MSDEPQAQEMDDDLPPVEDTSGFVAQPVEQDQGTDEPPTIPDNAPLFVEQPGGRLELQWPSGVPDMALITPEALQMLVNRANGQAVIEG